MEKIDIQFNNNRAQSNMECLLQTFPLRKVTDSVSETEVSDFEKNLYDNLLCFRVVPFANLSSTLRNTRFIEGSSTSTSTTIVQADRLLGTDRCRYYAIGTPNWFIKNGFDGPIVVYKARDIFEQNENSGCINASRKYIAELRKYTAELENFPNFASPQTVSEVEKFVDNFQQRLLPLNMRTVARVLKYWGESTILSALSRLREWEILAFAPTVPEPVAIIFNNSQQLNEFRQQNETEIPLFFMEYRSESFPRAEDDKPLKTIDIYRNLGLNIGKLSSPLDLRRFS